MIIYFRSIMAGLVLLVIAVLHSLCSFVFNYASFGVFFVSVVYTLLFVAIYSVCRQPQSIVRGFLFIFLVLAIVFIHGTVSFMIYQGFDIERFVASNLLLFFYLLGAFSFVLIVQRLSELRGLQDQPTPPIITF